MYEIASKSPDNLSLIEAICESDPSAWCFLPVTQSDPARCSQHFFCLWKLTPVAAVGLVAQGDIARAFTAAGVPAAEFFQRVLMHNSEVSASIQLLLDNKTRIKVAVQCVFSNPDGAVIGRLLRFRVLSDRITIDQLIDQIETARKQLRILSARELEIVNLVYEGWTNKTISSTTGICEKTVEKQRARILVKLGLNCTAMMVRIVTVARMLPSPVLASEENSDCHLTADLEPLDPQSSTGFSRQPPTACE